MKSRSEVPGRWPAQKANTIINWRNEVLLNPESFIALTAEQVRVIIRALCAKRYDYMEHEEDFLCDREIIDAHCEEFKNIIEKRNCSPISNEEFSLFSQDILGFTYPQVVAIFQEWISEPMRWASFDCLYEPNKNYKAPYWEIQFEAMDYYASLKGILRGVDYIAFGGWPKEKAIFDQSVMSEEILSAMIDIAPSLTPKAILFADMGIWINGLDPTKATSTYLDYIQHPERYESCIDAAIIAGVREKMTLESIRDVAMRSVSSMERMLSISLSEYYERGFKISDPIEGVPYGAYASFEVMWEAEKKAGFDRFSSAMEFCLSEMQKEAKEKIYQFHKPVVLMSHLVKVHPGINGNFAKLAQIAEEDGTFAEKAWECLPSTVKSNIQLVGYGKKWVKKPYEKLDEIQKKAAREAMCYVFFQTAFVLYWGGKKYGYEGEEKYDEFAEFCRQNYAPQLNIGENLSFERIDKHSGSLVEAPVPYTHLPLEDALRKFTIALAKPLDSGSLAERLAYSMEYHLPISRHELEKIRHGMDSYEFQREKLFNLKLLQMLKAIIMELSSDSEFRRDLNAFGVPELLSGEMSFEKWRSNEIFPHFFTEMPNSLLKKILAKKLYFWLKVQLERGSILDRIMHLTGESIDELVLRAQEKGMIEGAKILDVDFGPVVEMLCEKIGGTVADLKKLDLHDIKEMGWENFLGIGTGESKACYFVRHLAKILSRVASQRPEISISLDRFFEAVLSSFSPHLKLSFSLCRAQWDYSVKLS